MARKRGQLTRLLESNKITAGMSVRCHGDHLILGRSGNGSERDDRVRLTATTATTYILSIKRHTGRWERTPFYGSMEDLVEIVWNLMPHLVAP